MAAARIWHLVLIKKILNLVLITKIFNLVLIKDIKSGSDHKDI